jgi:hypothetical protein
MSDEEKESNVIHLRVLNSSIGGTTSHTYQCRITLSFESPTKAAAEKIISRFQGMEMTAETTLFEEALDIAKEAAAEAKEQGLRRERELQVQIQQLLQTSALQTKEIQRLRGIEDQLKEIAQFAVNPSGAVIR